MTKLEYDSLALAGFTPLPGRCVILLDPVPSTIGRITIPDSARVQVVKACGYLGRVLAVEPEHVKRVDWDRPLSQHLEQYDMLGFKVGDRVLLGLHMDDLTEEVIWARNPQVDAVITD